jgi:microcystin-dependent protein
VRQLIGEIRRISRVHLSGEWIPCDGSLLPIAQHQPLFSLLGWRFGGDGRTTFAIPVMHSRLAGLDYFIAADGLYPTTDNDSMFDDAFVGEIRLFGGERPPAGWMQCDGRRLPIGEPFLALFDVIGKTWGGDAEYFAVPDLRSNEDAGVSDPANRLTYIIAIAGMRPKEA